MSATMQKAQRMEELSESENIVNSKLLQSGVGTKQNSEN